MNDFEKNYAAVVLYYACNNGTGITHNTKLEDVADIDYDPGSIGSGITITNWKHDSPEPSRAQLSAIDIPKVKAWSMDYCKKKRREWRSRGDLYKIIEAVALNRGMTQTAFDDLALDAVN